MSRVESFYVKGKSVIPKHDIDIYNQAGFGRKGGLGQAPALVIIDVQYRTVGHARVDIATAIDQFYPTAVGEWGWQAVDRLAPLLQVAREHELPIVYPHVAAKEKGSLGRLGGKVPSIGDVGPRGYDFVEEVAPIDGDVLIPKKHPSAFFATAMTSELIDRGVDTLLVAGCTTSGCIRASVTDAFSLNFRVGVIEDAVYDRSETSHAVNLFDIANKYADLMTAQEAVRYITSLREG